MKILIGISVGLFIDGTVGFFTSAFMMASKKNSNEE